MSMRNHEIHSPLSIQLVETVYLSKFTAALHDFPATAVHGTAFLLFDIILTHFAETVIGLLLV